MRSGRFADPQVVFTLNLCWTRHEKFALTIYRKRSTTPADKEKTLQFVLHQIYLLTNKYPNNFTKFIQHSTTEHDSCNIFWKKTNHTSFSYFQQTDISATLERLVVPREDVSLQLTGSREQTSSISELGADKPIHCLWPLEGLSPQMAGFAASKEAELTEGCNH